MSDLRHIKSALISVFHKDGLEPIVAELKRLGVTIYSTGGTQTAIEAMGAEVVPVESVTDYPSILGGRVKTLHPRIHGGILARRGDASHEADLIAQDIAPIAIIEPYGVCSATFSAASTRATAAQCGPDRAVKKTRSSATRTSQFLHHRIKIASDQAFCQSQSNIEPVFLATDST